MWFTGTTGGLSLFDGTFPVARPRPDVADVTILIENERGSIAGDPSSTLENKLDIPVLDRTPWPFRVLAPHQDLQFICDRPFFFTDSKRAFLVTSTGTSGKRSLPDLGNWTRGDLIVAWRADYFPAPRGGLPHGPPPPNPSSDGLKPFTMLLPGPHGRRVATKLPPINLKPAFKQRTLIPTFWTNREYTFANFHHAYLCQFVKTLNRGGIPALLSLATQRATDSQSFEAFKPTARVLTPHPIDEVEFQTGRAYDLYNWELFFHIPLLIADQLSKNQRFEEAQRWFHFIFDPTGSSGDDIPQRYWRTKPFYDRLASDYAAESVKTVEQIVAEGVSPEWDTAVAIWRNNPFSPHAVARLRTTAYQKTVVTRYIDNLIAWGDQLFRRETIESINEATHLYVLAAEVLGRRPEVIRRNIKPAVKTFNSLSQLGLLGNSLEQIELLVSNGGDTETSGNSSETPDLPSPRVLYFCVPENDKLLGYWNTVANRLFKIRHCMNIEGQVRELPLFEPPIEPALLVRAKAAGLSISEVLSDITVSLPNYRFSVMLQKANELVAEVRNLGSALLSALEKRDAEAVSNLRFGHELQLLQAIRDIRVKQIDEANANITALEKSRETAQARKDYYESREFKNPQEAASLALSSGSLGLIEHSRALRYLAGKLASIGALKLGSPTTAGAEVGPDYVARSLEADAGALDATSNLTSVRSQLMGREGEFRRRQDEWDHQAKLATVELKQIDQQLTAAQIRLAVAEQELRNHDRQIDNAREVDEFLRIKFTNQDLYQWMIGQVSGLYFQSYQLAYDLAKRAEQCFRFELGLQDSGYIQFGYWDSLKKGLLSGDKLQYDLRRLETAYLEQNRRKFELTKSISLLLLDPLALVKLRETGRCFISLPEEIFDLDYPGHYFRCVESAGITLPCVVGPYMTLSCTLRLLKNSIRINTTNGDNGYPRNTDDNGLPADDDRFVENNIPVKAIATSHGQNDSGMFELNFRDERYLPFEGAGVISNWSLELFSDPPSNNPDPVNPDFGRPLRQFDYSTISDAILHIKYTAREDAGAFKDGSVAYLRNHFSSGNGVVPSIRMFDLRREFPSHWHRFLNPANPADGNIFVLEMSSRLFRILDQEKTLKVNAIWLLARCADPGNYSVELTLIPPPPEPPSGPQAFTLARVSQYGRLHFSQEDVSVTDVTIDLGAPPRKWQLKMTNRADPGGLLKNNPAEVEDVLLVLGYQWQAP